MDLRCHMCMCYTAEGVKMRIEANSHVRKHCIDKFYFSYCIISLYVKLITRIAQR